MNNLIFHAKGSKLTYTQVSKLLRKSFVQKWIKQYEVRNVDLIRSAKKRFSPYNDVEKGQNNHLSV